MIAILPGHISCITGAARQRQRLCNQLEEGLAFCVQGESAAVDPMVAWLQRALFMQQHIEKLQLAVCLSIVECVMQRSRDLEGARVNHQFNAEGGCSVREGSTSAREGQLLLLEV